MMNVVLVGECGTGKSSLINLIIGRDVAETSNDTTACTTELRSYRAFIDGCSVKLWDTPGVDEGSTTTRASTRSSEALVKSLHRLQSKGDIHLLVYCMHGNRAKAALLKHYETIRTFLPAVPIVAVVTRLERYQNLMEDWWSNNEMELASLGMHFTDHACITAVPDSRGLPSAFRERLVHSQRAVRDLIRRNCPLQLLPVRFPVAPVPDLPIRGHKHKDLGHVAPRTVGLQITSRRARVTMFIAESIPAALI